MIDILPHQASHADKEEGRASTQDGPSNLRIHEVGVQGSLDFQIQGVNPGKRVDVGHNRVHIATVDEDSDIGSLLEELPVHRQHGAVHTLLAVLHTVGAPFPQVWQLLGMDSRLVGCSTKVSEGGGGCMPRRGVGNTTKTVTRHLDISAIQVAGSVGINARWSSSLGLLLGLPQSFQFRLEAERNV